PMITGNMMTALGAVAAGCKFYAAYPMSPATSILHWMAGHTEQVGVVVKQAEDEIAAINLAIGAGHAGVRALTATSGGGFALMTEAIGMAGMIETPVVVVNVMRGGPSTGLPTKTEQGDLNQAIGASQGDFPRVIVAPKDAADCFSTMVESFNLAEKWQLPVIVLSDLYLGEHRSTLDPDRVSHDVPIDRGEWADEDDAATNHAGGFLRYRITDSGVSPRARAGQKGLQHTSATDEHDERGILVSDEHTNAAIRRKMIEKRMRKMDGVLASLPAPAIEGPADAEATLIGWGSMWGVINEAAERLRASGIPVNQLHFKWLWPFHENEARALLEACNRTVVIEANFSGQFARHLRAETGFTVDEVLLKYDGEPIEPQWVVGEVKRVLQGADKSLDVDETEVREMAYHFIRIHLKDQVRPVRYEHVARNGSEAVWNVDLVDRKEATPRGRLVIGHESGKLHAWEPTA
ncbi:MAG: 2-oxoacid:acceptor oxidoreductase subunit alpha, partial [Planctomycetota bacterium]|nr:2-oxoacid:acceptor oxidoreductase subunit alpha [Planctomycetota bacterium]